MATLKAVTAEISRDLHGFTDEVARKVGSDLYSLTLDRIFTKGIAADGAKIGTYAESTVSLKKSEGRFTSKQVNLRDTETLVNSYRFQTNGNKVELGFIDRSKDGVKIQKK